MSVYQVKNWVYFIKRVFIVLNSIFIQNSARVAHLREIRVLLDAAVFRMDAYMKIAPGDGLSNVNHMVPPPSGGASETTNQSSANQSEPVANSSSVPEEPVSVPEPEEIQPLVETVPENSANQNDESREGKFLTNNHLKDTKVLT